MVAVPLKKAIWWVCCVEKKTDSDRILNKTNSKLLVFFISCYRERKKPSLETDEAVRKKNGKIVIGK